MTESGDGKGSVEDLRRSKLVMSVWEMNEWIREITVSAGQQKVST